jgi:hypothetical protein
MEMLRYKLFIGLFLAPFILFATESETVAFKFRVYLNDKGTTSFSIANPQDYLSEKAIARRIKQQIAVDETDLPISPQYIAGLEALGCTVVAKSKWLATITVHCTDSAVITAIKNLSFVKNAVPVWKKKAPELSKSKSKSRFARRTVGENAGDYGSAWAQIAMHHGDSLHRAGFRGYGMDIAVIDGGFSGLDGNFLLDNIIIKGRKNFVYPSDGVYEIDHGMKALSCMAANMPGLYVGTAPEAAYWLLQSENPASEYPVEEDYWVAAAEYADSTGVDVINSSLGYSIFDDSSLNYASSQLDGKTPYVTQGAAMAANKGILVVGSAGNEGAKSWHYITSPADAENILTVGAIGKDSVIASFSSRGPTADSRIKPDVVAVGSPATTVTSTGSTGNASGTSFSSPIMCGLATCLWQAYPQLTNLQLIEIIRKSADRHAAPDNNYGHGIPDMIKAMDIAGNETAGMEQVFASGRNIRIIPDKTGAIRIVKKEDDKLHYRVRILSIDGKTLFSGMFSGREESFRVAQDKGRVYIVNVRSKDFSVSEKVCF